MLLIGLRSSCASPPGSLACAVNSAPALGNVSIARRRNRPLASAPASLRPWSTQRPRSDASRHRARRRTAGPGRPGSASAGVTHAIAESAARRRTQGTNAGDLVGRTRKARQNALIDQRTRRSASVRPAAWKALDDASADLVWRHLRPSRGRVVMLSYVTSGSGEAVTPPIANRCMASRRHTIGASGPDRRSAQGAGRNCQACRPPMCSETGSSADVEPSRFRLDETRVVVAELWDP